MTGHISRSANKEQSVCSAKAIKRGPPFTARPNCPSVSNDDRRSVCWQTGTKQVDITKPQISCSPLSLPLLLGNLVGSGQWSMRYFTWWIFGRPTNYGISETWDVISQCPVESPNTWFTDKAGWWRNRRRSRRRDRMVRKFVRPCAIVNRTLYRDENPTDMTLKFQ